MDNRVTLTAQIAQAQALRFTPGGVSAISVELEHSSEQVEAGERRQVRVLAKAVAFGEVADRLARAPIGQTYRFDGFLATPRNGRHPVIHVQAFQPD